MTLVQLPSLIEAAEDGCFASQGVHQKEQWVLSVLLIISPKLIINIYYASRFEVAR